MLLFSLYVYFLHFCNSTWSRMFCSSFFCLFVGKKWHTWENRFQSVCAEFSRRIEKLVTDGVSPHSLPHSGINQSFSVDLPSSSLPSVPPPPHTHFTLIDLPATFHKTLSPLTLFQAVFSLTRSYIKITWLGIFFSGLEKCWRKCRWEVCITFHFCVSYLLCSETTSGKHHSMASTGENFLQRWKRRARWCL